MAGIPSADGRRLRGHFRRWIALTTSLIAVLLSAAAAVDNDAAADGADKPADINRADERRTVHLIRIPLPITGSVDDRVTGMVDRLLDRFDDSPPSDARPVLIFEFWPKQGETGQGSQFERCLALARYLAGDRLSRVRTVAYVPRTIKGHAVLVAMACEEIIMHPDAELGDAGIDETSIDSVVRGGYKEISDRRRTLPFPVALGMLDRRKKVYKVQTPGGTQWVLSEDLENLKQKTVVAAVDTLIPEGEVGRFTGGQLRREHQFVSHLASDQGELAEALGLSPGDIEQDPSFGGKWRPIRIDLRVPITTTAAERVRNSIKDKLDRENVNFVCLWIDSPGGSPQDSLMLANFLAGLNSSRVRTVAYVPDEARADAALVALACDQLVMYEDAVLGGSGAHEMDDEVTEVRAIIRESISKEKSRRWSLMAAMIDPNLTVHRYTLNGTSRVAYFCKAELDEQPDPGRWQKGPQETTDGQPYQVTGSQAEEVGLARHVVSNFDQFKERYRLEEDPGLVEPGWADTLIDALGKPQFAGLLLFIGGVALVAEVMSPGIGVGGFMAALCFLLFFWSRYLMGVAGWLEIMLFLTGVSCLALEVFVFPGFGVFGLGGGALILVSLVLASQTFVWPQNEYQMRQLPNSLFAVGGAAAGVIFSLVLLHRYLHRAPVVNQVMLAPPQGDRLTELNRREAIVELSHLVGRGGTATTQLTPSGKARFGAQLVDVISDGELIRRGTQVVVVDVRGNHVMVQAAREPMG